MRIHFLVLAYKDADAVLKLVQSEYFRDDNCRLTVHYDAASPNHEYERIREGVAHYSNVDVCNRRIRCNWGQYSLVEATLELLKHAIDSTFNAEYFYIISESCFPIKPFSYLQDFLTSNRIDHLESVDPSVKRWTVGGYELDRLKYHYPANFQTHRRTFEFATKIQQRLKFTRRIPNLSIRFGSQWMAIRRKTALLVVDKLSGTQLSTFFRSTWIPDEFAIHSVIATHTPSMEISGRTLTYFEFDSSGRPLVMYDDSVEHLLNQPFFFARKRSPYANRLLEPETFSKVTSRSPMQSDDMVRTADYQIFSAEMERKKVPVGQIDDAWWHPIDKIERPYYCVSGTSRRYVKHILSLIGSWGHYATHGYVFDLDRLEALPNNENCYYNDNFRAWRNYSPRTFFYDLVMREERETIFAVDWNDLDEIRSRLIHHPLCNILIVGPDCSSDWKNVVFRLDYHQVCAFLRLPKHSISDAVREFFSSDDIGYWERVKNSPHSCRFPDIDNAAGGVYDGVRAALRDVSLSDVFEDEYFQLYNLLY